MKNRRWTKEEDSLIVTNYPILGLLKVTEIFGGSRTYQAIKKRVGRLKVKSNRQFWSDSELDILINNYKSCDLDTVIKMLPGRTWSSVTSKAFDLGINNKNWTGSEISLLIENYRDTNSSDLVEMFGGKYTYEAIKSKCSYLGIKKPKRKFSVNDSFFSIPNILNSYWAGFLAADGYVSTHLNRVGVTLSIKDVEHLQRFSSDIEYTGSIKTGESKSFGKTVGFCTTVFTGERVVRDLSANYNISDRKSLTLMPPDIRGINFLSYIIGYIDGDGSVGIRTYKNARPSPYVAILGTEALLSNIKRVFDFLVPQSKRRSKVRRSRNIFVYNVSGKRFNKLLPILCSIKVPRLRRKWQPAIEFLNNKGHNIDYDYYSF